MISKKDKKNLELARWKMEDEGLDYCFRHYSSWDEIRNKEFRELVDKYVDAANALEGFIQDNTTDEEQ